MPTPDHWPTSGLENGAAADALRAIISLQLTKRKNRTLERESRSPRELLTAEEAYDRLPRI
jgi:hypothetical protein